MNGCSLKAVKILLIPLMLLYAACNSEAQTPIQIKSLKNQLKDHKSDTTTVNKLVLLGKYYLKKPGEFKTDLDSAALLAKQANSFSQSLSYSAGLGRSMLLEAEIFDERKDRAKFKAMTQEALDYLLVHKMFKEAGDAYMDLARCYPDDNENSFNQKIDLTEKAVGSYHTAHAIEQEATALKELGDYYQLKTDWQKSLKSLERSKALYDSIGYKETQGVTDLMGFVSSKLGNNILALKYGLMAAKTAEERQDTSLQRSTIYNRLAMTYHAMGMDQLALDNLKKALRIAQNYKEGTYIQSIQINIIILLVKLKKPQQSLEELNSLLKSYPADDAGMLITSVFLYAEIYMDLKEYKPAKKYVDSLEKLRVRFPAKFNDGEYDYRTAIRYYFETREFQKVYKYLKLNEESLKTNRQLRLKQENEFYWSKTDSALNNGMSALQHYQAYKIISDSLKNQDQRKQLAELQFKFDVDNKDQHILLLTQQGQIQKTRLKEESAIRNIYLSGVIVLFAFSALLLNGYRQKKRSNVILIEKQEEINNKNGTLRKLLEEKEWLLKEIHHRVKNNLQIVISLLNTQSSFLENEDVATAIKDSQHRMQAMSLIHQKLYQSDNLTKINLDVYFRELVDYLKVSYNNLKGIRFNIHLDSLSADVALAVPLGLIVNEAVSNSIKYAFEEAGSGEISISIVKSEGGHCKLTVADNGKGLPETFNLTGANSLGMLLMRGLTSQIDGSFELINENGVKITVIFNPDSLELNKKDSVLA